VVLISGEPGIGKSRLTVALAEHIGSGPHTRLRYFCSPHHQDSALYPFIAQLERAAGFAGDDTPEVKLSKLRALLAPGAPDGDDFALLSELVSLPVAVGINLSPQRKREKLFEALLNQLEAEAQRRPVLMVFEDAHWIDPTSHELLDLTVDRVRRLPVLLAITFRPEFQPPWGSGRDHVTSLALNRLGERAGEVLVQTLAGNTGLTAEMVAEIVERADGVPLFVEELTKAVLEGTGQGDRVAAVLATASQTALSVPATLHASLMARLDRLGPSAKEVAQIGAVLGREFAYEQIDRVACRPDLAAALGRLTDAGLLFRRGAPPHATYLFKHALVQDAAYSTLLRGRRHELHARVAAMLEAHFADLVERQPELMAHHLTGAGQTQRAVNQWLKAGQQAAVRSANREAVAHFRKGLDVLAALPEGPQRDRVEMGIQMALGPALFATKVRSDPDIGRAYARAWELSRELEDHSRGFMALRGLQLYHLNRAEMEKSQHFAEEALRVAERLDDAARLVGAHMALGVLLYYLGKLEPALAQFRRGLELFDPNMQFPDWPGSHPAVQCQFWPMLISWMLGYPDRSLDELKAAVRSAETLGHPLTLAQTLCLAAAFVHIFRHEPLVAASYAERTLRICEEHRIAQYHAIAVCVNGWALSASGESEKGLAQIGQGLDSYGLGGNQHMLLALQADAQLASGKPEAALASVAAGLEAVEKAGGAPPLEAELHRLRGEALLAGAGTASEAETAMQQGIDVSRRQNAKSWELRGVTSLARLRRQQGRPQEAAALLAPILRWFTEGLDTADLKEAKALLDKLTEPAIAAEG
jgi:tetratricopeptide (TPR) repeat protein